MVFLWWLVVLVKLAMSPRSDFLTRFFSGDLFVSEVVEDLDVAVPIELLLLCSVEWDAAVERLGDVVPSF